MYMTVKQAAEKWGVSDRRVPVRMMGAQHEFVQPYLIQLRIEQLMPNYAESTEHIVRKLSHFHIGFEGIHSFIAGNGRTGRLLVDLELMKAGYPLIDIKSTDRIACYNAFDEYYVRGGVCILPISEKTVTSRP